MELGVGEALVSFLDAKGTPGVVERALVCPPHGQIGPITPEQRSQIIKGSVVYGHYEQEVDRESAYEKLKARVAEHRLRRRWQRMPRSPCRVRAGVSPNPL